MARDDGDGLSTGLHCARTGLQGQWPAGAHEAACTHRDAGPAVIDVLNCVLCPRAMDHCRRRWSRTRKEICSNGNRFIYLYTHKIVGWSRYIYAFIIMTPSITVYVKCPINDNYNTMSM